jgi:hypothetical protein
VVELQTAHMKKHQDDISHQWYRAIEWLTAACFVAAVGCALFTYIGAFELAVPIPLWQAPTTYLVPLFVAAGVALFVWTGRRTRHR